VTGSAGETEGTQAPKGSAVEAATDGVQSHENAAAVSREKAEAGKAFEQYLKSIPEILAKAPATPNAASIARLDRRRASLSAAGEGSVLVYAMSAMSTLYLTLVTADGLTVREVPVKDGELSGLALSFHRELQDPSRDPRVKAGRLYDLLIRPLEEDLSSAKAERLSFSLDGDLRYVPVAALWDGEKWLCERYPLSLFTNSTVDSLKKTQGGSGKATARALGTTAAWPPFKALQGVATEARAIIRTPDSPGGVLEGEILLDQAFTREAFSESLASRSPVVHVASHFQLVPGNAADTSLLLGDGTR
jgi:CHAT domain-containing protein